MEFKDHFSVQSDIYARYRPNYPDELFRFLASLTPSHSIALDCATGNGQAAVSLATYFQKVIATDGSEQQIKNAIHNPKVEYHVALADEPVAEPGTVDLLTIASALHWMNFDAFYKEANKVLKPGGVIAGWAYFDNHIDSAIDPIIQHLSNDILANYWPSERAYITNYYKNIPFPFKLIETPAFKISVKENIDFLFGYFHSWSSTQKYIKTNRKDPVELIKKQLEDAWGDLSEKKKITWNLMLKVGRKE